MEIGKGYLAFSLMIFIMAFVNLPVLSQGLQPENRDSKFLKSDDAFESEKTKSEILAPPTPELHSKKIILLENAKRDLESLRLFTKQLRRHNEMDDIEIMEEVSNDFMKKHIDELLDQKKTGNHYETVRLSVAILFTKAMLYYEFNNMDGVVEIMDELKENYGQYYDIAVNQFGYNLVREFIEKLDKLRQQKMAAEKHVQGQQKQNDSQDSLSNNVKDLSNNIKALSDNLKNIANGEGWFLVPGGKQPPHEPDLSKSEEEIQERLDHMLDNI